MLYTKVIPNPFNDSGYVIIVYRKWWIFSYEVGRCLNVEGLEKFSKAHDALDGVAL